MKNYLYYTRAQAEKAAEEYRKETHGYIPTHLSIMDSERAEPCDDFLEHVDCYSGQTPAIEVWAEDRTNDAKFGWWED